MSKINIKIPKKRNKKKSQTRQRKRKTIKTKLHKTKHGIKIEQREQEM